VARFRPAGLILGAVFLAVTATIAQGPGNTGVEWLYPVVRHARIGAIDGDGREVIPPAFEALGYLTIEDWPQFPRAGDIVWQWSRWEPIDVTDPDTLIPVSRGGRWGLLRADGSTAIEPGFERLGPFGSDVALAPARVGGRWGYIGRDGEFVIEPEFDNARPFFGHRVAAARSGNAWGLIDARGDWVVTPRFDQDPHPSSDVPFPVVIGGKWGYLSVDGKMVIEPRFDAKTQAMTFREGLANVQVGDKMGFVDETGKIVIEARFDVASPFSQGVATVQSGDRCGYIVRNGQFLVPLGRYDVCHHFFGPLARVAQKAAIRGRNEVRWGAIDEHGQEVVPVGRFDSIDIFHEGLAAVEKDGSGGYIDGAGELVIPLGLNGLRGGRAFSSGLAPALGGKGLRWQWGFIDRRGEWVIEAQYEDAQPFRNGLAFVEMKNRVGLVDQSGKVVFEVSLDDLAR